MNRTHSKSYKRPRNVYKINVNTIELEFVGFIDESHVHNKKPFVASSSPVLDSSSPVLDSSSPVMVSSSPVMVSSSPILDSSSPVMVSSSPVMVSSSPIDYGCATKWYKCDEILAIELGKPLIIYNKPCGHCKKSQLLLHIMHIDETDGSDCDCDYNCPLCGSDIKPLYLCYNCVDRTSKK